MYLFLFQKNDSSELPSSMLTSSEVKNAELDESASGLNSPISDEITDLINTPSEARSPSSHESHTISIAGNNRLYKKSGGGSTPKDVLEAMLQNFANRLQDRLSILMDLLEVKARDMEVNTFRIFFRFTIFGLTF
jgi:hypothetical protein